MTQTQTPKERPIIMQPESIRALLAGNKTQTRRLLKVSPDLEWHIAQHPDGYMWPSFNIRPGTPFGEWYWMGCKHGMPGDRLWVRETFAYVPRSSYLASDVVTTPSPHNTYDSVIYREGWELSKGGLVWTPSVFMPRWASRLLLEIVSVRVERLQEITESDAKAEGITHNEERRLAGLYFYPSTGGGWNKTAREAFSRNWNSINPKTPWSSNPWVFVIEFRRVEP